jgi:hypothetical protein
LTVAESCYIPPEIVARALFAQLLPLSDTARQTQSQLEAAAEQLCLMSSITSFALSKPPSKTSILQISPLYPACPTPSSGLPLPQAPSNLPQRTSARSSPNRPTLWSKKS